MRPQGQQIIANLAKKLAPTQRNPLTVNGYTDNTPVGPELRQEGLRPIRSYRRCALTR